MTPKHLAAADLHDLFLEAANTERWLPADKQRSRITWWPAMRSEWLSYAPEKTSIRLTPSAAEVDRYYLAIQLSARLSDEDRRLVWAVAFSAVGRQRGPRWTRIARMLLIDRRTVRNRYMHAVVTLAMNLRDSARTAAARKAPLPRMNGSNYQA